MGPRDDRNPATSSRRGFLSGSIAVAASAGSGGCLQESRSRVRERRGTPISLTIKTAPADENRPATEIARSLATNLSAVGIDATVKLQREDVLLQDVLVDQAFDVYVSRYPAPQNPDFLRSFLHSRYGEESGWQNPFGIADPKLDGLLTEQRRQKGAQRHSAISDVLRHVVRQQPFTVVGFPDDILAARKEMVTAPKTVSPEQLLADGVPQTPRRSETPGETDTSRDEYRIAITDDRVTKNRNPLSVGYRNRGLFTGLLYDPLARRIDGTLRPWLAREWSWDETDEGSVVTVTLREGTRWHDRTPLTATDVAFTCRFLADTALGTRDHPIPAPRFRGRVSLIDATTVIDDRTLRLEFAETPTDVAERALTVPILPEHIWRAKTGKPTSLDVAASGDTTQALVWKNPDPVGSGLFAFKRATPQERLVLERFEHHVFDEALSTELGRKHSRPADFDRIDVRVAPSDAAAVELLKAGTVNATATTLDPSTVPRINRSDAVQLHINPSRTFYHVGYNIRGGPLSNAAFRRCLGRLIDRRSVGRDIFEGYLAPAAVPLNKPQWIPDELEWDGEHPTLPFPGTAGELDRSTAKEHFRSAGYRYAEDGTLLNR